MAIEIERKFVLMAAPDWLDSAPAVPIEQGYLAVGEGSEVRLRRIGGRAMLTVKTGAGLSRGETEIGLSEGQFEALWPLTEGRRLSKVRHRRETDAGTIEIDVYGGVHAGLIVAEIEFDSTDASAAFTPPDWLGIEVTGDERWANASLARSGSIPAIG